jgi:hypothetical protein
MKFQVRWWLFVNLHDVISHMNSLSMNNSCGSQIKSHANGKFPAPTDIHTTAQKRTECPRFQGMTDNLVASRCFRETVQRSPCATHGHTLVIASRRTGHIPRGPQPSYSKHKPILRFPFLWVWQISLLARPHLSLGGKHKYTVQVLYGWPWPAWRQFCRQLRGGLTLKVQVTPCVLAASYRRFGGTWCLHIQGKYY